MYSDLYLQKRSKVPGILLALVLVMVAGGFSFYFFNNTSAPTRASKKTVKQHEVTNLSSKQIGVFWESEVPDRGWILYGESASDLSQIALDERDTAESKEEKLHHFAMLKNLKPDTQYFYKIVSNNELIGSNGEEAFQIKTPRDMLPGSSAKPAYGKALLSNGEAAQQAFVVIRFKDAYPLVTMTGPTGEWLMPLQGLISKNDNQPSLIQDKDLITIEIIDDNAKTTIDSLVSKTNPLPQTIILGKDYKFLDEAQVLPAFNQRERPSESPQTQSEVDIRFPRDGSVIPGSQPLIRGVGVPGKDVIVNINSNPQFSARVPVDAQGDWRVSIPGSILPGNYTLIMTSEDANGKKIGEKRTFSLAKSGEQVLGDATGSATLTPTKTLTPSPTKQLSPTSGLSPTRFLNISPTLIATLSPTLMATNSASISATMTPTITPTIVYATSTPAPAPPVAGVSMIPYIFAGFGMIVAGAGVILLF